MSINHLHISRKQYDHVHGWLRWNFVKPTECEKCGCSDRPIDWANISGEYKKDRTDFMALCRSCHGLMDKKNLCRKGHELTPDNVYIVSGNRMCRQCHLARVSAYGYRKRAMA